MNTAQSVESASGGYYPPEASSAESMMMGGEGFEEGRQQQQHSGNVQDSFLQSAHRGSVTAAAATNGK